jgi:hypothetical protein
MFKLRNVAGAALVIGIAAGIWLGDLWKGFGTGSGLGLGNGGDQVTLVSSSRETTPDASAESPAEPVAGNVLRVVIRDRSYYLKTGREERRLTLEDLVQAVRNTPGDADGLRLRVYRAEDARVTADVQLREALRGAQIPESAIFWSPDAAP